MKAKQKMNLYNYATENLGQSLILFASICVLITGFFVSYKQQVSQLNDKNEIISEQKKMLSEQRVLMLGGDGYVFFRPYLAKGNLRLGYEFQGKYPFYDTSITIESWELLDQSPLFWQKQTNSNYNIGTIHVFKKFESLVDIPMSKNGNVAGKKLFIKINSRSSIIEQHIYYYRIGTDEGIAYLVTKMSTNSVDGKPLIANYNTQRITKSFTKNFRRDLIPAGDLDGDTGWNLPTENDVIEQ